MLKHIKLNPIEKIVQIIYECDESFLTKDLIMELQKFIPSNDEVKQYIYIYTYIYIFFFGHIYYKIYIKILYN